MNIRLREDVDYPPVYESKVYIFFVQKHVNESKLQRLSIGNPSMFFPGISLNNATTITTCGWVHPNDYYFENIEKLKSFISGSTDEDGISCVYLFYDHETDELEYIDDGNIEKCYAYAQENCNVLSFISLLMKSMPEKHKDVIWDLVDIYEYFDFVKSLKK